MLLGVIPRFLLFSPLSFSPFLPSFLPVFLPVAFSMLLLPRPPRPHSLPSPIFKMHGHLILVF